MPTLASDIMAMTAAFLNDPNQRRYTNDVLLPFLKRAYRELERKLDLNGVRTLDETSADILVLANALTVTLPTDYVSAIKLWERTPESSEMWIPMEEKRWEPNEMKTTSLRYWVEREDIIQLLGASVDREVRINYKKSLLVIASEDSIVTVRGSDEFLESRVASLAARYIGENPTRANDLQVDAGEALDVLIRKGVKTQQGVSVRRRRYGSAWRRI